MVTFPIFSEHAFAVFGAMVAILAASVLVGLAATFTIFFIIIHFPRFHFGVPKASMELSSYGEREIAIGEDGKPRRTELKLLQRLDIVRWIGMSSRNRADWFIGIIRFHKPF
jgi:hypothetical protein